MIHSQRTTNHPMQLQQHNYAWPQDYGRVARPLSAQLHQIPHHIQHVGSTAIPHLISYPIIDIMIGIHDWQLLQQACHLMQQHNNITPEPQFSDTDSQVFKRTSTHRRPTHYIYIVEFQGSLWEQTIKFRDLLRQSPQLREQYGLYKLTLARRYSFEDPLYHSKKREYIGQILTHD